MAATSTPTTRAPNGLKGPRGSLPTSEGRAYERFREVAWRDMFCALMSAVEETLSAVEETIGTVSGCGIDEQRLRGRGAGYRAHPCRARHRVAYPRCD